MLDLFDDLRDVLAQDSETEQAQRANDEYVDDALCGGAPRREEQRLDLFICREFGAGAQVTLGVDRLATDAHFVV